jgi:gliding motility-associated-like protein
LKNFFFSIVAIFAFILVKAQVMMHPNRGQWDDRIAYKVDLAMGEMLIEKRGITYYFYKWHHPHHCNNHHSCSSDPNIIKNHVVRATFLNANIPSQTIESDTFPYYRNYYFGNDPSKWRSKIHSVGNITLKNIYPNIDLEYKSLQDGLKYSFYIAPNGNPEKIQIHYSGADKIKIDRQGRLIVTTSLGEIVESRPRAWTENELGSTTPVKVKFKLVGNFVSFQLGAYNPNQKLVIDPQLAFSTFTGATSDNWGFTACPDNNGNLYAGGIVFGPGYPVTVGAFDTSFNGGQSNQGIAGFDISITKFNSTGTANLYSTFLGGSGNEVPTSVVTNNNGELFVLSITSSSNFPATAGAFQTAFSGGPQVNNTLMFNGSDIAISRFNSAGTALLASTYIGGSGNDGLNYGSNLEYNYGDTYRGEIIVDNAGSVYFTSTTKSANFPVASTLGTLGGAQDAVYGKLPENLSALVFCRYFGGNGFETGNSIQQAPNGDIYITGGTTSSGLNFAQGGLNTNYFGNTDAYVLRISSLTGVIQNGTYLGTNLYDQGYFVQTDLDNNVYIFGQARGLYPQTPGLFGSPNSGQFIQKLTPNLMSSIWSTNIGANSGNIEISPTAFLVSNCYDIYIAGWGGVTNQSSFATQSSTNGFPTTPGAHQQVTNGSNFYLAVLAPDAAYLKYGTFMGGISSSFNHVDGGTSRFSKEGTIYHAVCGSCGANSNGFTTTPGVWSTSAMSSNCNLAAFKFNLSTMEAAIGNTDPIICIPNPVTFINNSSNGNLFIWDFGDGNTSNAENPTHVYTQTGNYTVTLIVIDTNSCYYNDTAYFDVIIGAFQGAVTPITSPVCPGSSVQLSASGGTSYIWSPPQFLDNPNIPDPTAIIVAPTTFTVIVSDTCGVDTLSVFVDVYDDFVEISAPDVICRGDEAIFSVNLSGLQNIQWSPPDLFINPNVTPVVISPEESVLIGFSATTMNGCIVSDEHFIQVDASLPVIDLTDSVSICIGSNIQVTVSGGTSYLWEDLPGIAPLEAATVTLGPDLSSWFYVTAFNACGESYDSVFVEVIEPNIFAGNDTIVCPGQFATLWAGGGVSYTWEPANFVIQSNANGSDILVSPPISTIFVVSGVDQFGCVDTAQVHVELYPNPFVQTSPDVYAFPGDPIVISAQANAPGIFSWSPPDFLSCATCPTTAVTASTNMVYTVTFKDENDCVASDDIYISFDAIIYVPNTFTPDNDKFNAIFKPEGGNIKDFHMVIFNRWGEVMFETYNFNIGWDGTYGGKICQDGTYIWVIDYTDINNNKVRLRGHVNLLR